MVIVGAGLAGSLSAAILGRAGYKVVLIDIHAVFPPDFRVEKIAGDQVDAMRRLGFLDALAAEATRVNEIVNASAGRVLDRSFGEHYSILYGDIVRLMRAQIPQEVAFIVGRVDDIVSSADGQRLILTGGDVVEARLVVVSTGQGDVLRQKLGIKRRLVSPKHSLTFGFSIRPLDVDSDFPAMTYHGGNARDRIDYLALLPLGDQIRANLFTFRDHRDTWVRRFRDDPKRLLLEVMPGLAGLVPDFTVVSKVQLFMMDLYVLDDHHRDGVVFIGDAFQTSCPAAGTGVSRLLVDVDRLCNTYVPQWLAAPAITSAKIAQFYDDPQKRAADAHSRRAAAFRRGINVETGLKWELRRRELHWRRWIFRLLAKHLSPRRRPLGTR